MSESELPKACIHVWCSCATNCIGSAGLSLTTPSAEPPGANASVADGGCEEREVALGSVVDDLPPLLAPQPPALSSVGPLWASTAMTTLSGLDTWSVISGAIGVLTVLPFIWAYVRSQHPETKLAELDSTLNDTEALLRSVVEEGLLNPVIHVPHFESRLKK